MTGDSVWPNEMEKRLYSDDNWVKRRFREYMHQHHLKNLQHGFDLILQSAKADLRTEASRGYLGVLWWIIEPILYMGTFYVVFAHLFKQGDGNFICFLLTGLVVWKWFHTTIMVGSNSLMANVGLMNQVYVQKIIFPLTVIAVNSVKFIIIFFLLLVFLFFTDTPSASWILVPCVIGTQLLLTVAITCLVSAMVPFFPDFRQLLDNILLVFLFLSGVFIDLAQYSERIQQILYLNPMAILITMYRQVLLEGASPDWGKLLLIVCFSLFTLIVANWVLGRYDRIYPKIIH